MATELVELTYRQEVLLKLLKFHKEHNKRTFKKRILVPTILDSAEWKYCNSMVDGNCLWFGGNTTRKNTKDRQIVHKKELGLGKKLKLISHANSTHTKYRLNPNNIKKYLLAALAKKYTLTELTSIITQLEKDYDIKLR